MLWLRGADRQIKKFDCTNESGVREIREHRDPGVHSRLHRDLSGGRGSDENQGLDFERCTDLEVDDGVDTTVTILCRLATWNDLTSIVLARMSMDGFDICVVLCCGCEVRTGTSRDSIARKNQEFERYAKIEILEFIHVCIENCQAEECPMRIMNAHRLTIFQHVKIEVAVFMMKPNEENRQWFSRMRAWKEEYDVCSSLPQSLSVAESEFVEFARNEKHDDQFDEGVAQCARGANNDGVSQSRVEWDKFDSCCAWCLGHKNV